jgi:hypothetical protein
MKTLTLWRHAACLVAGVLLFAFGASRALSAPVQQTVDLLRRGPVQVVTVDP